MQLELLGGVSPSRPESCLGFPFFLYLVVVVVTQTFLPRLSIVCNVSLALRGLGSLRVLLLLLLEAKILHDLYPRLLLALRPLLSFLIKPVVGRRAQLSVTRACELFRLVAELARPGVRLTVE